MQAKAIAHAYCCDQPERFGMRGAVVASWSSLPKQAEES